MYSTGTRIAVIEVCKTCLPYINTLSDLLTFISFLSNFHNFWVCYNLVSNNARQYYSPLCIVYRYVDISGIFKSQRGNLIAGAGYTNYPVWKGIFVFINLITLNVRVFLVCFKSLALYLISLCFHVTYFAATYFFKRFIKSQRGFSNAGAGYTFYPHFRLFSLRKGSGMKTTNRTSVPRT